MEDLDALLADLQITCPAHCPVLLTDSPGKTECGESRPPPPAYEPKISTSHTSPEHETPRGNKEHLYSTIQKTPASSVPLVLGGGLCELDRLLNELNATQFNITDEIMSQFPSVKKAELQKEEEERRALSASSATQELDRLMASLSDFHKQSTGTLGHQELEVNLYPDPSLCQKVSDDLSHNADAAASPGIDCSECLEKAPGGKDLETSSISRLDKEPLIPVASYNTQASPKSMQDPSCPYGELDSMMVKLQSGLKNQGIEILTKGLCQSCQRPIAGQVVTALGHTWHPEHFTCAHCHMLIGSTNFFEKDAQPYCERDYFALHAPRCAMCDSPIMQNMVTALSRTWHPEHFCCKICKKQIGEEGFHEKDGIPYCADDYFRLFGAVCVGCSEPVKQSYISALGGLWHPHCFVCNVCHNPFINGSFFETDGLPLCETHYHLRRGSLCAGCDQPITGRCVTAMGKKFHPQHLNCTFCLRQLNKGTFREHESKPYCQACYARLYS
uniref:Transforming growth factor beta-1-induced transcript 1 protein n=1 Tax=Leptobrachium leishanense TaxID=445787 RepID=A0A8C5Q916_9ANUR